MGGRILSKITIRFDGKFYDELTSFLYLKGISSFEEKDSEIILYVDPAEKNEITKSLMTGYRRGNLEVTIEDIENRNWNAEWEKSIEPVFIKDSIIIYPSWKKNEIRRFRDRIKIQIDPKMAFGTGHNETTCLVLELMSKYISKRDKYLLDYGCGTGILAIAGIKLGIEKAVANDTDPDAIENSKENLKLNRVAGRVKLYDYPIESIKEGNFDVICANIISSVLKESMGTMSAKLRRGGKLFLSGILIQEKSKLLKSLKKNFRAVEIIQKSEWLGIYAVKN